MKNKTPVINASDRNINLDWLYLETEDDDFLSGKEPNNVEYAWEDEE